ncbi:MAG: hypothetical protein AB7S26_07680 [Sandaracinaceae bacterium]
MNRLSGVRDALLGSVLVAIGILGGGSALLGSLDPVDYAFDGAGLLLIGWGVYRVLR